ncbi:MAG: protein translocase subunit SecD [Proteobacteria bacterium]|nr:protein translocase subunit SecD [Pseudomonadota bacterium]NDC23890.1 protein translocase subunit SecD [Pseudomonadota bacterium]NDD04029.1 protein translocase subunit SecD [Pseudomonadota bacterium]NDG26551.1 protein translocase subunit SecD [Pseudomonadota bacterium]
MKGLRPRIFTVFATVLFSMYLLIPTWIKFSTGKSIPKIVRPEDPWYFSYLPSETIKLGLDLMGGLHLVLGIDFDEVHRDAAAKLKNDIKNLLESEKIDGITLDTSASNRILAKFTTEEQWKKADKLIGERFGQVIDYEGQSGNEARLKMNLVYEAEVNNRAVEQSLETLRNRIDEFGIAEPIITRQGEDKIMVQFPGIQEPGRLKDIISRTAKLSFQIVRSGPEATDPQAKPEQLQKWVTEFKQEKKIVTDNISPITKHLRELNQWLSGKLPSGTEVLFQKKTNINTREAEYIPYLLERESLVTGEDLQDARYTYDPQTNLPEVTFQLTPVGATKFEKATGANVGKFMAIVLDSNVHSAPRIREKIGGGNARIEMGSSGKSTDELLKEAKDTSLVLRSGALPAKLQFLEERVVGPSLGADAIRAGTISLLMGLLFVFVFMAIYYRTSGLIATIALILNGVFIVSIMAAFEGTLTLPGLAGITLTLGMAVDANVLIFEHMREEILHGKNLIYAISQGYSRAFTAIFDAHITTIIAGIVLLSFGYGPIRGFAVTLLIGLVASLYTSVFVTRVIYDYFVVSRNKQTVGL